MNSFWNNNIALFCKRFPALAERFGITAQTPQEAVAGAQFPYELIQAKNGSLTAKETAFQRFLHSQYNPEREAEQACKSLHTENTYAAVFWSCGLGYAPNAYAALFPADTIILVEPSALHFFAALTAIDWTPLFSAKNVILAVQAGVDEVTHLLEQAGGGTGGSALTHCSIMANAAHIAHAAAYFEALKGSLKRSEQKAKINTFTLEKFSKLWLRNSCRNLAATAPLSGIVRYKDKCPKELPALILAAGPTLHEVLPHLAALKERMLLICVDTALRACLKAGVEPDFILLIDPQYYAYRHIAGLQAPSAVLITESAAYPATFRFNCRETILCSSLFPLGKYFEKRLGSKGELAAGGSVSTTAWDFARFCGATQIYCAGLDLGYPSLQTHIKGSTFEEKLHTTATRLHTAETGGSTTLFGANMKQAKDYKGRTMLTDDKMQLFAWWFESKLTEYAAISAYTLSDHSLCIPGFKTATVQQLVAGPARKTEREMFFAAERENPRPDAAAFKTVFAELQQGFTSLYQLAKSGMSICDEALANGKKGTAHYIDALKKTDTLILHSELKEAAALVFPTERRLNEIFATCTFSENPTKAMFEHSKIIYRELHKGVAAYTKLLF